MKLVVFAVFFCAGWVAAFALRIAVQAMLRWLVAGRRLGNLRRMWVPRIVRFGPGALGIAAVLLVLAFRLLPGAIGPTTTLAGTVTHVRDGDTIEVNRRPIRLNGLTCDELGTPLGDKAKLAMLALAGGRRVTCELNGERTYDREVGRCRLPDGRDLGAVLISQRLCGRCERYDPLGKYVDVQKAAGPFGGAYPSYCQPRR